MNLCYRKLFTGIFSRDTLSLFILPGNSAVMTGNRLLVILIIKQLLNQIIMKKYSRRNFLGNLFIIPAGLWLSNYDSFSAPARNQVKITAIKAMQLDFQFDGCLIKIETDAGLVGYGETGTDSKIARAHIEHLDWALQRARGGGARLIGGDPLSIRHHFYRMTEMHFPLPAPIGTISGIDIALWDLAGKILGQPVYKLLGGPFRDGCPMYAHVTANMHDPAGV